MVHSLIKWVINSHSPNSVLTSTKFLANRKTRRTRWLLVTKPDPLRRFDRRKRKLGHIVHSLETNPFRVYSSEEEQRKQSNYLWTRLKRQVNKGQAAGPLSPSWNLGFVRKRKRNNCTIKKEDKTHTDERREWRSEDFEVALSWFLVGFKT